MGLNTKNYLVISDLHLGEDLRPSGGSVAYLRHLARLEQELERFLIHHASARLDDRPWCLVVNGDMIDFMSIVILPKIDDQDGIEHDDDDRRYGMGFSEGQSQHKLGKVIARHRGVFEALARFVAAGNELVIVLGNHDIDFHYPSLQETLVASLSALADVDVSTRIRFCPWFYYAPDLLYVEHGHQYDEYCSFDYQLYPVAEHARKTGGRKSGIALSIAHAGMRYFANQLPEYDPHTAEHWGLLNYAVWAWAQGMRGAIKLAYFYGLLVWRVVAIWYLMFDRGADTIRRLRHRERLKKLAGEWEIAEDRLEALDALRTRPAGRTLRGVFSTLFFDRVMLGAVALAASTVMGIKLPGWWKLGGTALALGIFAGINVLLNKVRLRSPQIRLRAAPQLIAELVSASFIVFGHSHAPESVALPSGGVYFNTGSWATDDLETAFTHLIVTTHEERPRAELMQWRNGASTPYSRKA